MSDPSAGWFSKVVSFPRKLGPYFGIGEAFSREEERNIPLLIQERLLGAKRIFMRHPTRVNSHLRHRIRTRIVERLMVHGTHHGLRETLAFFRRSPTNYSNDTRHTVR